MFVIIDCSGIQTAMQLHQAFARELSFPHWYGHNLDALYDCLTDLTQQTRLVIKGFDSLPFSANGFFRALAEAEKNNSHLKIEWQ